MLLTKYSQMAAIEHYLSHAKQLNNAWPVLLFDHLVINS